jgi:putative YpdA family bacillithiol system oxidoreductase
MKCDLVIVGAGPAGLAAARAARRLGLSYVVLERARIAQAIEDYPLGKPLHSPPQDVELAWGELSARGTNATREELLEHYRDFAQDHELEIVAGEEVRAIERHGGVFGIATLHRGYEAKHVIVATGGFGVPRRLGVPGELDGRVSYRFVDGAPYAGREVLVVGGGNSAAEAALWLHEAGARVTLSLRRPSFAPRGGVSDAYTSVKPFNSAPLEALAMRKQLDIVFRSQVRELRREAAVLRLQDGSLRRVPCAHVFALLGADPDLTLLRGAGAAIAADGRPVYDPRSGETTVRGLYVAGHLTRELHIPKAIRLAPRVVHWIAGERPAARGAALAPHLFAAAAKRLRRRSALARFLVREAAWLRRAVQAVDVANVMRDKRLGWARQLAGRFPALRRLVRSIRATAS